MKIYAFYLKGDESVLDLYAYTKSKEIKKEFLRQRNKKKFIVKKIKLTKKEFDDFQNAYHNFELIDIPLSTGELTDTFSVSVLCTDLEESMMLQRSYDIDREMNDLYNRLVLQSNFKQKYLDSIGYLCTTYYLKETSENTKDAISKSNLLRIFVSLFSKTLSTK